MPVIQACFFMKIIRKRGSNSVTFKFGEKTFVNKAIKLLKFRGNIIKWLHYKKKSPRGGSIPPQKVTGLFVLGFSRESRKRYKEKYGQSLPRSFYRTIVTPLDLRLTPVRTLTFFSDSLLEMEGKSLDDINVDYEIDEQFFIRELVLTFYWPKQLA